MSARRREQALAHAASAALREEGLRAERARLASVRAPEAAQVASASAEGPARAASSGPRRAPWLEAMRERVAAREAEARAAWASLGP
eukprot:6131530-Lingulodinium_polyedra.AAC.1